jgi:BirA family biotin operon repressor/biotin-[acetyl-CoA-carboxylase] ligase
VLSENWRIEAVETIDSTNSAVAERARAGEAEGLVLRTNFQLAGKGRAGRVWEAPAGSSLMFSVLLRPPVSATHLQLVVAAVALSVRSAVAERVGVVPALKWPNDLLIDDRKVAGVLAEIVTTPAGPAIVVGVGFNLTSHPDLATATDLLEATGHTLDAVSLLEGTLVALADRRRLLDTAAGCALLREEYEAALDTLGRSVRLETPRGNVHGRAVAIDETGALVVERDGSREVFGVGDIIHLRREETP